MTIEESKLRNLEADIEGLRSELHRFQSGGTVDGALVRGRLDARVGEFGSLQSSPSGTLDMYGYLSLAQGATLNIASGVITPTQGYHRVTVEGAAPDDLDTINTPTGVKGGTLLILQGFNVAWNVTIKHNTGNIWLLDATDFELTNDDIILLCYDSDMSRWTEIAARRTPTKGAMKTTAPGYFLIPAGPASGTGVPSGAANTYGAWTQMIASTVAALYIVGLTVQRSGDQLGLYVQIAIGIGAAGAEVSQGEWKVALSAIATPDSESLNVTLPHAIPVSASTRIAVRVADAVVGVANYPVTLICIAQANLVRL